VGPLAGAQWRLGAPAQLEGVGGVGGVGGTGGVGGDGGGRGGAGLAASVAARGLERGHAVCWALCVSHGGVTKAQDTAAPEGQGQDNLPEEPLASSAEWDGPARTGALLAVGSMARGAGSGSWGGWVRRDCLPRGGRGHRPRLCHHGDRRQGGGEAGNSAVRHGGGRRQRRRGLLLSLSLSSSSSSLSSRLLEQAVQHRAGRQKPA